MFFCDNCNFVGNNYRKYYGHLGKCDKKKKFLMYLFDEGDVCRVSDIIWPTARPANYQLATKFIAMIHTDRDGDEDDVNYYLIKDELHKCISIAKDIPNNEQVV